MSGPGDPDADDGADPRPLIGGALVIALVLSGLVVAAGLAFAALAPHFWPPRMAGNARPAPVAAPGPSPLGEPMRSR